MSLLDFIYPKKCVNCRKIGEYLCTDCFVRIQFNDINYCTTCLRPNIENHKHFDPSKRGQLDQIWTITVYNTVTKKLIFNLKNSPNLTELAEIISGVLIEGLIQNELFYKFLNKHNPVVIPIPLHKKRLNQLGYNHSELIAYHVAKYFNLEIDKALLIRKKETKFQKNLNKLQRFENLKNAFEINKKSQTPKSVILIDDTVGSFATLSEAARLLKSNGVVRVVGIVFAKEKDLPYRRTIPES